jgi:hypothetical protein
VERAGGHLRDAAHRPKVRALSIHRDSDLVASLQPKQPPDLDRYGDLSLTGKGSELFLPRFVLVWVVLRVPWYYALGASAWMVTSRRLLRDGWGPVGRGGPACVGDAILPPWHEGGERRSCSPYEV